MQDILIVAEVVCAFAVFAFLYAKFVNFLFATAAAVKYRKWDKIPAEITKIELSRKIGTRGPLVALFQPNVFDVYYKYVRNGKNYRIQSIIDFKPRGDTLKLYVNPEDPAQSRVARL